MTQTDYLLINVGLLELGKAYMNTKVGLSVTLKFPSNARGLQKRKTQLLLRETKKLMSSKGRLWCSTRLALLSDKLSLKQKQDMRNVSLSLSTLPIVLRFISRKAKSPPSSQRNMKVGPLK